VIAGVVTLVVFKYLPVPGVAKTFAGILMGGAASIPLIGREIRMLFNM
jgi:hypothetical protein